MGYCVSVVYVNHSVWSIVIGFVQNCTDTKSNKMDDDDGHQVAMSEYFIEKLFYITWAVIIL